MKKKKKIRDPYATPARMKTGAGRHKDKKKEEDKNKCREKEEE